mmetsp:Transcript_95720/g.247474  ORF Transcript_95720/g.247474 Transcript_95720/m.247474 type:complete len:393 (-) Transcript_95720:207-1385(-)
MHVGRGMQEVLYHPLRLRGPRRSTAPGCAYTVLTATNGAWNGRDDGTGINRWEDTVEDEGIEAAQQASVAGDQRRRREGPAIGIRLAGAVTPDAAIAIDGLVVGRRGRRAPLSAHARGSVLEGRLALEGPCAQARRSPLLQHRPVEGDGPPHGRGSLATGELLLLHGVRADEPSRGLPGLARRREVHGLGVPAPALALLHRHAAHELAVGAAAADALVEVHFVLALLGRRVELPILLLDLPLVDDASVAVVPEVLVQQLYRVDGEERDDVVHPDGDRLLPVQRLVEDIDRQARGDEVAQHRGGQQLVRRRAEEEEAGGARGEDQELGGHRELQPDRVLRVDAGRVADLVVRPDALHETLVHEHVEEHGRQGLREAEGDREADQVTDVGVLRL